MERTRKTRLAPSRPSRGQLGHLRREPRRGHASRAGGYPSSTIFFVDIENLPAVESPKVSFDVLDHDAFELDVMCFDRPSTTLRTIGLVELDWAAQGLLPRSRRTSSCWRRRGPRGPRPTCPPAPSRCHRRPRRHGRRSDDFRSEMQVVRTSTSRGLGSK